MFADDHGLFIEADDLDLANPRVQELVSVLSRGDATKMSFAFSPIEAKNKGPKSNLREIDDLYLYEVSAAVAFPWYEGTSLELNSRPAAFATRARFLAERAAPIGAMSYGDIGELVVDAIEDHIESLTGVDDVWIWLDDMGPDWVVYEMGGDYFQVSYTLDAAGAVTLGDAIEVTRQTIYTPTVETDTGMRSRLIEARALLGLTA